MEVMKAPEWQRRLVFGLTLVALATLSPVRVMFAGEMRPTAEDRVAEREILAASQDIDRMHQVLGPELQRWVRGAGGAESVEVAAYLKEAPGKPMNLGNVRIALSRRFVERERRQMVAAIALAKAMSAEDCGDLKAGTNQLLDAAIRAKVLAALKCHLHRLDQTQSGMHKVNQDYEAALLELKLPPFTQQKMLAEARASTLRQDADLASGYARPRRVWQANIDLLTYLDEHAAHAHFVNNQLVFDDPAETEEMRVLVRRLKAPDQ